MVISFSEKEMVHVTSPHEDTLVITTEIDGYDVNRVLIDSWSLIDVLFLDALKRMGKNEKDLKKVNFPLMGFASEATYLIEVITLPVYFGEEWNSLTLDVTFIVVDAPASYNTILGRSTLNPHRMVHSTYHQLLKFPTRHGIGVVKGDQPATHNGYVHSV